MTHVKNLFKHVEKEILSEYEKSVSREHLKLFMKEHPARAPFSVRASDYVRTTFSSLPAGQFLRLHPVALSLILVLGAGVGTSYAAEGAVPGDTLYPVKIRVNESIQGALAVSDEAKIDWSIKQVNRRLDEAETLAYRGELTADARADIETKIEKSSKNFDAAVLAIADTPDPEVVASAASHLEVSLTNRERAFEKIANSPNVAKDSIAPIIERLKEKVHKAQRVRAVAVRFAELDDKKGKTAVNADARAQTRAAPISAEATLMQATVPASADATTTVDSNEEMSAAMEVEMQVASLSAPVIEVETVADFRAAILEAQGRSSNGEHKDD